MASFKDIIQPSVKKLDLVADDLECVTINGNIPPSVDIMSNGDIPIRNPSGGAPFFTDSGLKIDNSVSGVIKITPSDADNELLIRCPSADLFIESSDKDVDIRAGKNVNIVAEQDNINITSDNSGINLTCNSGAIQNNCQSFAVATQSSITLGANNTLTIQVGTNQIVVSTTSVEINCGAGIALKVRNNNGGSVYDFNSSASDNTTYVMPASNGLNGSVLTNDGTGVLSWVGGA
jgi:hypothetical protein